ncbi:MAG: TonB-dependent receptor [Oligoflexia bacterium]|nr:TonB-dependent receptor [Oligoflexia bacterium]
MKKALCFSTFLLTCNSYGVETIVVSAEKVNRSYLKSTSSIVSLNREDIESSHAIDLPDLLRSKAGISTFSNSSYGKVSSVLLRGNDNRHTLIELDGVVINDVTGIAGEPRLEFIPLDIIESVEVLKGSQSTLYGSGAVGGVVKITTRKGKTPKSGLVLGYGSYNNQQASFYTLGKKGKTDYSLSASSQDVEGISAYNEKRTVGADKDGYSSTTLHGKVGYSFDDTFKADLILGRGNSSYDYDNSTSDAKNNVSTVRSNLVGLNLTKKVNSLISPRLKLSEYRIDRDLVSGGSLFPYSGKRNSYELENTSEVSNFRLLTGIKYSTEKGIFLGSTTELDKQNENTSVYANSNLEVGALTLDAGVRHEKLKFFEDETVYKVGFNFQFFGKNAFKTSYSTGVKAPSVYQTFSSLGNKSLLSETSKSFEAGFYSDLGFGTLELVYFDTRYENYINATQVAPSVYQYSNISKAKIDGYEAIFKTMIGDQLRLDTSFTKLRALDASTGTYLLRRPRNSGSINVTYYLNDSLELGLNTTYVGRRNDTGSVALGSYVTNDLVSAYRFSNTNKLTLTIGNILDREYEQILNFGTPGRNFNLKYSLQF